MLARTTSLAGLAAASVSKGSAAAAASASPLSLSLLPARARKRCTAVERGAGRLSVERAPRLARQRGLQGRLNKRPLSHPSAGRVTRTQQVHSRKCSDGGDGRRSEPSRARVPNAAAPPALPRAGCVRGALLLAAHLSTRQRTSCSKIERGLRPAAPPSRGCPQGQTLHFSIKNLEDVSCMSVETRGIDCGLCQANHMPQAITHHHGRQESNTC
eukprot:361323-Chlamydomonas_euryale.AAC.9